MHFHIFFPALCGPVYGVMSIRNQGKGVGFGYFFILRVFLCFVRPKTHTQY